MCVGNEIEKENGNSFEKVCVHLCVCVCCSTKSKDSVHTEHPCIPTITHTRVRDQKPLYKHPSLLCNNFSEEHQHILSPLLLLLRIMHFHMCSSGGKTTQKKDGTIDLRTTKWKNTVKQSSVTKLVFLILL